MGKHKPVEEEKKSKVSKKDFKKKKSSKAKSSDVSDSAASSSKAQQGDAQVSRKPDGVYVFPDAPDFRPNMSPKEVLQAGSFGGTYFRPIYSSVTKTKYNDVWKELPADWLEGLNIKTKVASPNYRESVNRYGVKCGGSLEMWESSGWITAQDPYGWFMWYCRRLPEFLEIRSNYAGAEKKASIDTDSYHPISILPVFSKLLE